MANSNTNIRNWLPRFARRFPWLASTSLVSLIFLLVNRLLVLGKAAPLWDAEVYFVNYYALIADAIRAGRLLFWNPWSSGGEPLQADPLIGLFSPLTLLIAFITGGSWRGFTLYWLFMWWLGGAGMILLARHLGAPPWGAVVVALGFLFCGFYTGNAEHTPVIASFSFLPFVIWRLDLSLREQRVWPAIEAGALWGLSALTGYPGFTMLTGMYAALWAFGYLVVAHPVGLAPDREVIPSDKTRRPSFYFVLIALAAVFLVGVLIMSPSYVSFLYEGLGYTSRSIPLGREMAIGGNALHPGALATFANPYLLLLKFQDDLKVIWPYTDLSSASIYAGVVVTVLAAFGFVIKPRSGWQWWFLFLAALAIACALGRTLPLRGWLYDFVYPTRFLRHAALFRAYYLFTVAVLALLATKKLSTAELKTGERWKLVWVTAALAFVALVAIELVHLVLPIRLGRVFPGEALHFVCIWGGILAVIFVFARCPALAGRRYLTLALTILALVDVLPTGWAAVPTTMSTNKAFLEYKRELDSRHQTSIDLSHGLLREYRSFSLLNSQLTNENLITRVPVLLDSTTQFNTFYYATTESKDLWATATGDDRIWFSEVAGEARSSPTCLAAFTQRAKQLGVPPLVFESPEELLKESTGTTDAPDKTDWTARMSALPAARRIQVNLIRYTPEELTFDVDAPAAGWIMVTDRWARSWQATVNGESTTVYCGNFIFRAVRVNAGPNRLQFSYAHKGTSVLLVLSWGSLALVLGGAFYSRRRRRTQQFDSK